MSSISFDNYSQLTRQHDAGNIEVAGRYRFQSSAERRIINDVAGKLAINSDDSLLEIGCGPGNVILPLSYQVARSAGIDNEAVLGRLAARCGTPIHIATNPGDFQWMVSPKPHFPKVLIYTALWYVEGLIAAILFFAHALYLLCTSVWRMLDHLPNQDRRRRFTEANTWALAWQEWLTLVSYAGFASTVGTSAGTPPTCLIGRLFANSAKKRMYRGHKCYLRLKFINLLSGNPHENSAVVETR